MLKVKGKSFVNFSKCLRFFTKSTPRGRCNSSHHSLPFTKAVRELGAREFSFHLRALDTMGSEMIYRGPPDLQSPAMVGLAEISEMTQQN